MTRRPRLLLADDHPLVVAGLTSLLEPNYDLVAVVADGHELLLRAQALRPDVIVADISMPRLSGFEVVTELKKLDPAFRVVVLTMHDEPGYARRALALGASAFVPKHAPPAELITAIQAVLAGETYISPAMTSALAVPPAEDDSLAGLTPRQRTVLRLIGLGCSVKAIAGELGISTRTVEYHKYQIMDQLSIRSGPELLRHALAWAQEKRG